MRKSTLFYPKTTKVPALERVLKNLKALQEDFQRVTFEKDELQLKLSESNKALEQSRTQVTELRESKQELKRTELQLSDIEIQYSTITEKNSYLKEHIHRLDDKLRALRTEKDELPSQLNLAQQAGEDGYSKGTLFNTDLAAIPKREQSANMEFASFQTNIQLFKIC